MQFLDKEELLALVMTLWQWTCIYRAVAEFWYNTHPPPPFEKYFKIEYK